MTTLEIAVASIAGARVAARAGADRVELCSALELGGVTPSQALVEAAVAVGLPVRVLVRCRPGDFVYDADDIGVMAAEIRDVVRAGATGVVVGALTRSGTLDVDAMQRFVDAARSTDASCRVILHRAVDHAVDPVATIAALAGLGVTGVLTSGGAERAVDGLAMLRRMRATAPGIELVAGGGVTSEHVAALVAAGADAVHASAKRAVVDRHETDASIVERLRSAMITAADAS